MAKVANTAKLPKGSLKKLTLGQSFAEYDKVLEKSNVFVETPAIRAALDLERSKCFFVGRRGTGKTAITFYLQNKQPNSTVLVLPELLTPIQDYFTAELMSDTHQRPFKSLVAGFKRAMLDEVISGWIKRGLFSFNRGQSGVLTRERNYIDDYDFDTRLLSFTGQTFDSLNKRQDRDWLKEINRWKEISDEMAAFRIDGRCDFTLLFDRIDEAWDGSDKAVILVMALMHACIEMVGVQFVRPLVFLRENVFEKVRVLDKEFSRLETLRVLSRVDARPAAGTDREASQCAPHFQVSTSRTYLGRIFRAARIRLLSGDGLFILSISSPRCPDLLLVCDSGRAVEAARTHTYRGSARGATGVFR